MSVAIQWPAVAEGSFSARLKALREARGLTQRELAKLSGLDHSHLGLMETRPEHEPRHKTKQRLAEALGVSVGDLDGTAKATRSWKADFMSDPAYSSEVKKVVIQLVEAEERRQSFQKRRK